MTEQPQWLIDLQNDKVFTAELAKTMNAYRQGDTGSTLDEIEDYRRRRQTMLNAVYDWHIHYCEGKAAPWEACASVVCQAAQHYRLDWMLFPQPQEEANHTEPTNPSQPYEWQSASSKPGHNCPDWDEDYIYPKSPEMESCLCQFTNSNQPAPVTTERSRPVGPEIEPVYQNAIRAHERLQYQKGLGTYGDPLREDTDIDWYSYAMSELPDIGRYVTGLELQKRRLGAELAAAKERIAALDALTELHQLSPHSEIRLVPSPEMNGRMMWWARLENYHRHADGGGATIEAAILDLLDKAKGGDNAVK